MLYTTIRTAIESEITEKKSRFICILNPITGVTAVEEILTAARKQFPGARHYCYAYRLRNKSKIIEKYSDDGEPNSTAGVPILNVLRQQGIEDIMAVVVRYFGGTLLGTGGLVRAYSGVVIQSLAQAEIISMELSWMLSITMDYSYYSNFQNKCRVYFSHIEEISFADQVSIVAWIACSKIDMLLKILDNITLRTAQVDYLKQDFVPQNETDN